MEFCQDVLDAWGAVSTYDQKNLRQKWKSRTLNQLLCRCETPIEQILLLYVWQKKPPRMVILPQVTVRLGDGGQEFRLDFLVCLRESSTDPTKLCPLFCVECDGSQGHTSKRDVERDKWRDNKLYVDGGLPTMRFPGHKITRDPCNCTRDIIKRFDRCLDSALINHRWREPDLMIDWPTITEDSSF